MRSSFLPRAGIAAGAEQTSFEQEGPALVERIERAQIARRLPGPHRRANGLPPVVGRRTDRPAARAGPIRSRVRELAAAESVARPRRRCTGRARRRSRGASRVEHRGRRRRHRVARPAGRRLGNPGHLGVTRYAAGPQPSMRAIRGSCSSRASTGRTGPGCSEAGSTGRGVVPVPRSASSRRTCRGPTGRAGACAWLGRTRAGRGHAAGAREQYGAAPTSRRTSRGCATCFSPIWRRLGSEARGEETAAGLSSPRYRNRRKRQIQARPQLLPCGPSGRLGARAMVNWCSTPTRKYGS